ncbi:conserved hypothetical protein [Mesorhizobium plurifarium]|uniref:Uncharacterized protein n=1 Tax=Mesorhizobium plurifarium TaxID=69974 RepID=A0A090DNC4_MESPL|nr:conserved hypothetical protein [Mesorhizobium plurifarium]
MIFSQTAESISSGFADEPQDEDAQPADFAVASNWSKDLVLTKLSSEIVGKDMNGSVPGWTLQFEAQKLCQLKNAVFSSICRLSCAIPSVRYVTFLSGLRLEQAGSLGIGTGFQRYWQSAGLWSPKLGAVFQSG